MTAKERLRQAVEVLTQLEAEPTLAFIARRRERDPLLELFENAPEVDEPLTPEERASLDEAWEKRHDSVPLDEFMREFE